MMRFNLRDPFMGLPKEGCRESRFYFYDFCIDSSVAIPCSKCAKKVFHRYGRGAFGNTERLLCFQCMWQEGVEEAAASSAIA